jgi:hypothetical protein
MTANRSRSSSPTSLKRSRSNSPTSRKKARTETPDQPTQVDPGDGGTDATEFDIDALLQKYSAEMESDRANPLTAAQPVVMPQVVAPAPVARPKPANFHTGMVSPLRGNFGKEGHDKAHLVSTRNKTNHGVWRNPKGMSAEDRRTLVKKWVSKALRSINTNDDFVVGSKPGLNGGRNYLVSMDGVKVGKLSGSNVPLGLEPPATHIEVYLKPNGDTVSAFPSDPSIF